MSSTIVAGLNLTNRKPFRARLPVHFSPSPNPAFKSAGTNPTFIFHFKTTNS